MKLRTAIGYVLFFVFPASGCSTSYVPRPSPRVAVVMKGGTPSYVRDGQFYAGGGFGGDFDKAVQGNPEAEAHARAYQDGMLAGFLTSLGGAVSMGAGVGVLVADSKRSPDDASSSAQTAGLVLIAGGLAASIVSAVLFSNAQPHHWDAINIYNDGLPDSMGVPRPPYAPYAVPPLPPQPLPAPAPSGR